MPDSWPSMRSMARYVLPVLVGPSTAVRRPAALESDIDPTFARARGRSKAAGTAKSLAGDHRLQLVAAEHRARVGALHDDSRTLAGLDATGIARPCRRRAVPTGQHLEMPYDVEVLEHAALVLAARDRRRVASDVDRQRDVGRLVAERESRELDRERAVDSARQLGRRALGRASLRVAEQRLDRAAFAAGVVADALDHHLRRVDVALLQHPRVGALALGGGARGERILPADIVPVVDVIGQRHDVGTLGQAAEIGIRWRAGTAALRREEFYRPRPF